MLQREFSGMRPVAQMSNPLSCRNRFGIEADSGRGIWPRIVLGLRSFEAKKSLNVPTDNCVKTLRRTGVLGVLSA